MGARPWYTGSVVPWTLLDRVPAGAHHGAVSLHRRGDEYSIRVDGQELMNSRRHGSEEAMAQFACAALGRMEQPRVMVGGLGMGFTLAASNRCLPADATIDVVELVAAVVTWNRGTLGDVAGRPLSDARVQVHHADVRDVLGAAHARYDAVLLDVDNGPDAFTQPANQWLYGRAGLARIRGALRRGGVLSVWSARPDARFTARLREADFETTTHRVGARGAAGGGQHTVWIAKARDLA